MDLLGKLQAEGWTLVPATLAPEGLAAANACAALPKEYLSERGKPFLRKLFKEGCENIPSELYALGENKNILATVEAYLGEPAHVVSIRLFHSIHTEGIKKSQLYHCDGGPEKMVKLFLHCSDVTLNDGPFSFLPITASKKVWKRTNYDDTRRLTDDEVRAAIGPIQPIQILGAKGTMFLVDSAQCFHYGARVNKGGERLVAVIQYAPV